MDWVLEMASVFEQSVKSIGQETNLAIKFIRERPDISTGQLLAQLKDVTRSNSFLWFESILLTGERLERKLHIESALSRLGIIGTVAADLIEGYLIIQQRERWLPWLAGSNDWELQNERGA